jgi:carboxyl-terminal processing protease
MRSTIYVPILSAIFLIVLSTCAFSNIPAQGRWAISLEAAEGNFIYPVDINSDKGKISVVVLRGGLKIDNSSLRGDEISMTGEFRFEPVTIRASVVNFTMKGTWKTAAESGKMYGEFQPAATRMKAFDEIWETTNSQFYDPLFNGADWAALKKPYREQIRHVKNDGEFYLLINRMLSELKSSHVGFYAANRGVFSEARPVNKALRPTVLEQKVVEWRKLNDKTGYLKISSFAEGEEYVKDIDKAFAELGDLPMLIIDLRGNEGGTLSIAMRLGDYIYQKPQTLGVLATRKGLDGYDVDAIEKLDTASLPKYSGYNVAGFLEALHRRGAVTLVTGGRAEKPYLGKIAVLADGNSASASEGFISAIKETGIAKLIGRRTEGALLSSRDYEITGGWTLKLPEADFCTPKGFRPEAVGIEPDIEVKIVPGKDADLEAALHYLNGN